MTFREAHKVTEDRWLGILASAGLQGELLRANGPCPLCGGRDRFTWFDRSDGFWICRKCNPGGGDGFRLLAEFRGIGLSEALGFAVNEAGGVTVRPSREPGRDDAARLSRLEGVLEGCVMPWGTLSEDYLAARGIPRGPWSGLRHHEALLGAGVPRPGLPALVALVERPSGVVCTLHRTFLSVGSPRKADIGSPKQLMPVVGGSWVGGCVRLSHLAFGDGSPALGSRALVVGEGIESSLAAGIILESPAWSCLTAGGLKGWVPPDDLESVVGRVIVAGDWDESGAGQGAAHGLASRLWELGWVADVMFPPDGFSDWADVLAEEVSDGSELGVGRLAGGLEEASAGEAGWGA